MTKKSVLKSCFSALLLIAALGIANLSATANADGGVVVHSAYPYANPYFATVTVRLLHTTQVAPKIMAMAAIPGRNKVTLFAGRQAVEVAVYTQSKPAPLMYVIPGMGGTALDGTPQYLAEKYFLAGFNVLVMPSPLYWKFVLGQSTSGLAGYTPADVKDLTRLMLASRARAEQAYGMRVTHTAVIGYSLGAIQVGYMMKQDHADHALGLERAILVNPPLSLAHSLSVLDQLNAIGDQWTLEQRNLLWGSVIEGGSALLSRDINDSNYFIGLDQTLALSDTQLKYLIGNTFRQSLSDVVMVSQQIHDSGLLHLPATSYQRNARESEAARVDFNTYLTRAALPYWSAQLGQSLTTSQLIARGDLASIRQFVTTNPSIRLVHNVDDFLNDQALIQSWGQSMGKRAVLFPHGGHVGNLWSPDFDQVVIDDVRDLLN